MRTLIDWLMAATAALLLALIPMVGHAIEPGHKLCRGDVCIVRAQAYLFGETLFDINERVSRETETQFAAEKRRSLADLHANFSDAELFVLWNDPNARAIIQTEMPGAWAIMSEIMHDLAYQHRYESSRTYKLDYE